jgi:hypothetical protein
VDGAEAARASIAGAAGCVNRQAVSCCKWLFSGVGVADGLGVIFTKKSFVVELGQYFQPGSSAIKWPTMGCMRRRFLILM